MGLTQKEKVSDLARQLESERLHRKDLMISIDSLAQSDQRKGIFLVWMGGVFMFVAMCGDFIAMASQIRYADGFGGMQVALFFIGLIMVILGVL